MTRTFPIVAETAPKHKLGKAFLTASNGGGNMLFIRATPNLHIATTVKSNTCFITPNNPFPVFKCPVLVSEAPLISLLFLLRIKARLDGALNLMVIVCVEDLVDRGNADSAFIS